MLKHTPTIVDILSPIVRYGSEADVIDALDRVWHVITNHSGFILNGRNHEAHIPYWSSYTLSLPKLRLFDSASMPLPKPEASTISDVILTCGEGRYIDDAGIVWAAKLCTQSEGYELEECADNAWLPWKSCKVLSLPGFRLLQTEEQVKARNLEWV